jgi:hypothetical protein
LSHHFLHFIQRPRDFVQREIQHPDHDLPTRRMFKEGWGADEWERRVTRYTVPMCEMNQGAVLTSHFAVGLGWVTPKDGEMDKTLKKAFSEFLNGRGRAPEYGAWVTAYNHIHEVVLAVTGSSEDE